jgi:hypothetical protein
MSRRWDRPETLFFCLVLAVSPGPASGASSSLWECGRAAGVVARQELLQPGPLPRDGSALGTRSDWESPAAESELRGSQDRLPVGWMARACAAGRRGVGRDVFLSECPASSWIGTYTPSAEFCVVLRRFRV